MAAAAAILSEKGNSHFTQAWAFVPQVTKRTNSHGETLLGMHVVCMYREPHLEQNYRNNRLRCFVLTLAREE